MTARTDRLLIEPLAPEHADELFAALDDERVGRYLGGPDVTTVEALTERIGRLQHGAPAGSGETWLNWAVRLDSEGHPVIGRLEATVHDGLAEVAYVFGPAWWGHGYATEGVRWMLRDVATRPDVDGLWATVDPANVASARLLGRLGFRPTEPPDPLPHSYDPGDLVFHRSAAAPTVHLLCGRNGAGKTTLARALARSLPAVRLSRDEWMIRLHGLSFDDPEYAALLPACTDLLWDVALDVLATGVDVVLDWNQWSRSRRAESAERARSAGHAVVLHHVDTPIEQAISQAAGRTDPTSHRVTAEVIAHFETIYEPPTKDEGIPIRHHR